MKSKNWLISIFALIIMVAIISVTVVVTVNNKKTNLNEKIISEIDYLDKTMIAMVNKLIIIYRLVMKFMQKGHQ